MSINGQKGDSFAPLELTEAQHQHCQDLTFQLLGRTLHSYDERNSYRDSNTGLPRHHASLDNRRWRRLKTQANASLYAERSSGSWRDLAFADDNMGNPCVLLAAGTIDSTLDEVMFGLAAPDFAAMRVRSEVLANQSVDGAVLAQLAGPTEADPFQFMGVLWLVGEQSWPLNIVVRPRDFVIVFATGVITRSNGERIGYEVVQSIDLPQCPELLKPMIRGKLMHGAIYKEQQVGTVDVYIQMYAETHGRILDKIVATAMWESALGFWRAPRLSELKKLQWWKEQASSNGCNTEATQCNSCLKKSRASSWRRSAHLSAHNTCILCTTPVCSSCRVKRTLKMPSEHSGKLLDIHVVVCPACMRFVLELSPSAIAMQNHKQRQEADEGSRRSSRRVTLESVLDQPATTSLGSVRKYPSISKMVKLVAGSDTSDSERRKTYPLH
ncbi:hypothetical protein PRIC2_004587 [Phytophthora ramorum]